MDVRLPGMSDRESTDDELLQQSWAREQYVRVLVFNVVVGAVETLLAAVTLTWFISSSLFGYDAMDSFGLLLLPLFYHGSLFLPILGIWLWFCFLRVHPKQRRWLPITLISTLQPPFSPWVSISRGS